MIFSDLDGTLLDHATYDHAAAAPALRALKLLGTPLVLASSKTAAEIVPLHSALDLGDAPAIVENGAAIVYPQRGETSDAPTYHDLRRKIAALPEEAQSQFRGFGDMTTAEVAELTGLSLADAALARDRRYSEPGVFEGSDEDLSRFLDGLRMAGLSARRGGRFLTLSFGGSKAYQMARLIGEYRPMVTIALGDAPNDAEMLDAADFGVIVRNDLAPKMPELPGEAAGRIRRTVRSGPAGWNEAVLDLLSELDLSGGRD